MMGAFEIDGMLFDVDMLSLERQLALSLTENAGTTMDGCFHWDARVQEVYLLRFRAKPDRAQQLGDLWDCLKQKRIHRCALPYGADTAYVDVYVESCRQPLDSGRSGFCWGELEVRLGVIGTQEESHEADT